MFQAVFSNKLVFSEEADNLRKYYDTEYVRNLSLSHKEGMGAILIQKDKTLAKYPDRPSLAWYPEHSIPFQQLSKVFFRQTVNVQCKLLEESVVSSDKKTRQWATIIRKANLNFLKAVEEKMNKEF